MYTITAAQHQWIENILLLFAIFAASIAVFFFSASRNKSQQPIPLQILGIALLSEAAFFYVVCHTWQINFVHHGNDFHSLGLPFNYSLFILKWPITLSLLVASWLFTTRASCRQQLISFILAAAALTPMWLPVNFTISIMLCLCVLTLLVIYSWRFIVSSHSHFLSFSAWSWLVTSTFIIPIFYICLATLNLHETLIPLAYALISGVIIVPFCCMIFLTTLHDHRGS